MHTKTSEHMTKKDAPTGGFTKGGFTIGPVEEDIFSRCSKNLSQSDIEQLSPLNAVLYHQCKRFHELDLILQNRLQTNIIIAKDEKSRNLHDLGTGIAINSWIIDTKEKYKSVKDIKDVKEEYKTQDMKDYLAMQENLDKYIKYLQTKYGDRITFGNVGQTSKNKGASVFNVTRDPSDGYINVWGADVDNWNLKKDEQIRGGGQASSFEKQDHGVFGICTMKPVNTYQKNKVLEKSIYTTIVPGNPSQIASPSPQIKKPVSATPVRQSVEEIPPVSVDSTGHKQKSKKQKLEKGEWATSESDISNRDSDSDSERSDSDSESDSYRSSDSDSESVKELWRRSAGAGLGWCLRGYS
jgi:hypothetical protein